MERTDTGMSFLMATAITTGTEFGPCAATLVSALPHPAMPTRAIAIESATRQRIRMTVEGESFFMGGFFCGIIKWLSEFVSSVGRCRTSKVTGHRRAIWHSTLAISEQKFSNRKPNQREARRQVSVYFSKVEAELHEWH